MIIENGTIEFLSKYPGAIDPDTGHVSPSVELGWSKPVPCQYVPNGGKLMIRVNGEHYSSASFVVLIEMQSLPDSEQLRLTDRDGNIIGDFRLLAAPERLDAVGQIKILI